MRGNIPFLFPPFVGGMGVAARCAAWSVQLFALLPDKGGILFPKRIPPLNPPEKGKGSCPLTPHIGSLNLEELRSLRNQVRCTWLRHESSACRFMLQPRPTSWGASDGSLAADCLRIDGFASLAAFWGDGTDSRKHLRGTAALLRSPPRLGFC